MTNTPAEKREKKIQAAEKSRGLIKKLGNTKDLEAHATMLHDRVSEGIKDICSQDNSFDEKQKETLSAIAVHLALLFDPELENANTFFSKIKQEFMQFSFFGKITALAAVVALVIGILQLGTHTWNAAGWVLGGYQSDSTKKPKVDAASTPSNSD